MGERDTSLFCPWLASSRFRVVLYVTGSVVVDPERRGDECDPDTGGNLTLGVLALDTATGEEAWSSLYHSPGHEITIPAYLPGNAHIINGVRGNPESHVDIVIPVHVHVRAGGGWATTTVRCM